MADEEARPATATVDKEALKELSEILAAMPVFKAVTSTGKGKEGGSSSREATDREASTNDLISIVSSIPGEFPP